MKKRIIALFLTMTMVFSLCACGGTSAEKTDPPAKDSTETSDTEKETIDLGVDTIKIGCVTALTGNSASMGVAIQQGMEMAIKEINAAGGIAGVPIEMVIRDDEADPTNQVTLMEELVYKEEVNFVIGSCNSSCALASQDLLCENEIVEMICLPTASTLTNPEVHPYIFRNTLMNTTQAEWFVDYCKKNADKSVVCIGDNTALGTDGMALFEEMATEAGINVVDYISFVANDADLTSVAQGIQNSGADIVISFALGTDAAKIVKAMDRLGCLDDVTMIGFTGMRISGFRDLVGDIDCSNVLCLDMYTWTIGEGDEQLSEEQQAFYDMFVDAYGHYTNDGSGRFTNVNDAARVYDAIYFYKWIVEQIGTIDGTAVKEAFETMSGEWQPMAASTPYNFTETDHEGFPMEECVVFPVADVRLANDYLDGDIPTRLDNY